ncbi:MAG TPA: hypothetical protein PLD02_14625, partial [Saprospiraceae bacterium]|nr:hypothetical protein [Saprospiraceae bacterium]
NEFAKTMLLVPALSLEDLIPQLQNRGYKVIVYRNPGCKTPYQLGVYSMALDVQDDEEKIKLIAGKRFDVQGIKNAEEIIIKLFSSSRLS